MIVDPKTVTPGAMYRLMISVIVPRPIAFVSTADASGGTNAAPFSYFVPLASEPPLLGISINHRAGEPKDTLRNLRETGEFVVNVVSEELLEHIVHASGDWPPETSEIQLTGLTPVPSDLVRPPGIGESPVRMECRLYRE